MRSFGAAVLVLQALACTAEGRSIDPRPGVLEGVVTYRGLDCPPTATKRVPPCSGPFSGLEIEAVPESGKVASKTRTDGAGRFRFELAPGSYAVRWQMTGRRAESRKVALVAGAKSKLDIAVDSGVR